MVDILRALEKLRKLRKEAAARKGDCGFGFLPLFSHSFPFFTLAPRLSPIFEGKMLAASLFSPSRLAKPVNITSGLWKQEASEYV